ncbi:O-antigen polysaccharide polymerase Wzy family protein [Globicatella sanguinis]
MDKNLKKEYILPSLSIIVFISSLLMQNFYLSFISILFLIVSLLIFSATKIFSRVLLFGFTVSTFLFNFGRIFAIHFLNAKPEEAGLYGTSIADKNILIEFYLIIFLSILTIWISFIYFEKRIDLSTFKLGNQFNLSEKFDLSNKLNLRGRFNLSDILNLGIKFNIKDYSSTFLLIVYFILFIFRILVTIERINFVNENNFHEQYLTYTSQYSLIIVRLSETFLIPLFMYLSIEKRRSKTIVPLILLFIEGVLDLFTGRRMNFVLNLFIIFVFLVVSDKDEVNKEKKPLITKRNIIVGMAITPLFIYLLQFVNDVRTRSFQTVNSSFISNFLYKQGVTLKTVLWGIKFKHENDNFMFYSLGSLTEFILNNPITQVFIDKPVYTGQSVERALETPLFDHRVSYYIDSKAYLLGRGYGSSYVIENYIDGGILGVIIGSIILGFLLCVLIKILYTNNLFLNTFCFLLARNIFVLPRSGYTSFITATFTTSNVAMFILLYCLYWFINKVFQDRVQT